MTRTSTSLPLAALLALPVTVHAADAGTWTGPYGGVNVTVVAAKSTATGSNTYTTTTNDGGEGNLAAHSAKLHSSGLLHTNDGEEGSTTVLNTESIADHRQTTVGGAGVRLGYNYQFSTVVLGVEGDGNIFNFTTGGSGLGNGPAGPNEGYTIRTHGTLVGTVRARAGLAFDRILLFGTAGAAFTNLRSTLTSNSGFIDSKNKTTGWVAGGGAELRITRQFSLAATVLYNDFGTTQLIGGDGTSGFAAGIKTHYVTGAVGINMHF